MSAAVKAGASQILDRGQIDDANRSIAHVFDIKSHTRGAPIFGHITRVPVPGRTPVFTPIEGIVAGPAHETVVAHPSGDAVVAAPAFDVVVTDLSMPELSGLALSSKLSAIRPELPIVLVSGHAPKADEQLAQYGIRFRLAKPFEIDVLDALLRGLVRR